MEIPPTENIVYGLSRGEIGMVQSVTNIGKTTLLLNLSISLATGREFPPLCEEGQPRKVLYIDYETPVTKFRDDLLMMAGGLSGEQREAFDSNFFSYNLIDPTTDEVRLSDPTGMGRMLQTVQLVQPDLIIIDTISQAFPSVGENDNTELMNKLLVPLGALARKGNSALLFAHHIGKQKAEEGQARDDVHRSRGGSAYGGAARVIIQLDQTRANTEVGTWLSYVKAKDVLPAPTPMTLDPQTRWFETGDDTPRGPSLVDVIKGVMPADGSEITRADIAVKVMTEVPAPATLSRVLRRAVDQGVIEKTSQGKYRRSL